MPKLYGFSITEFIHYYPEPNTVAISFASKIDRQFDPKLYDRLKTKYQEYDNTLEIHADDVPKPVDNCQVFTMTTKRSKTLLNNIMITTLLFIAMLVSQELDPSFILFNKNTQTFSSSANKPSVLTP